MKNENMHDDREKDTVRAALENVEPSEETAARMYRNILKKAQTADVSAPRAQKAERRARRRAIILRAVMSAACLCLFAVVALRFLPPQTPPDIPELPGDGLVQSPNPMEGTAVDNAEAFLPLGITLDAPAGAREVYYAILDGEIARVSFALGDETYVVLASAQSGDFSGVSGPVLSTTQLDARLSATLEELDGVGYPLYRVFWTDGKINYCLLNTSPAEAERVATTARLVMSVAE